MLSNRVPLSGLSGSGKRVPSVHCRTSRTVALGRVGNQNRVTADRRSPAINAIESHIVPVTA
jgi:hypothetical protein